MRIGLISDTHIPVVVEELLNDVLKAFRGVDLIMHAGDIYEISVLDALEKIAPVIAAMGDDDYSFTIKDTRVKERHSLTLEGKTVWLMHELPFSTTMTQSSLASLTSWWAYRVDPEQIQLGKPNVIVFGHEHRTFHQIIDEVLFVNPGSPTLLNFKKGPGSLGILELSSDPPEFQIIRL